MNPLKSNSRNMLLNIRNRLGRSISTAPPPLLNQPHPFSATVRHASTRYDSSLIYWGNRIVHVSLPINWGIRIVPQHKAFVVERLGRYSKTLTPGIHLLIPFVDKITYVYSLKEEPISIPPLSFVTDDGAWIQVGGVLYVKVVDPKLATYKKVNPHAALIPHAQYCLQFEIDKINRDKIFEETENIEASVLVATNFRAQELGLRCIHYEIGDISPAPKVTAVMEALSKKCAYVSESEGERQEDDVSAHVKKIGEIIGAILRHTNSGQGEGQKNKVLTYVKKIRKIIATQAAILRQMNSGLVGKEEASRALIQSFAQAFAMALQIIKEIADEGVDELQAERLRIIDQYIHICNRWEEEGMPDIEDAILELSQVRSTTGAPS